MSDKPTVDVQTRAEPPTPLTERKLALAEKYAGDARRARQFLGGAAHIERLAAEVRRLRSLFPDPEVDAVACEAFDFDFYRHADDMSVLVRRADCEHLQSLAARLRSLQGEP